MIRQALTVAMALGLAGLMAPYALDLGPGAGSPQVVDRDVFVEEGMLHVTVTLELPGDAANDVSPQDHSASCGGLAPFTAQCRKEGALTLKSTSILVGIHTELGYTGIVRAIVSTDTGVYIQTCEYFARDTPLEEEPSCSDEADGQISAGQELTLTGRTQTIDHPDPSVGEWSVTVQNKNH